MTIPVKTRRVWANRLKRLAAEQQAAQENLLVGIFMAREDGIPQQVIADAIEGLSASGVSTKARRGAAILQARKGESRP